METVHEFSMEEAADLIDAGAINACGDRRIRVLDLCSGPGGVGRALHSIFSSSRIPGWFLGVDIVDYSDRYLGDFVQGDIRDLTLADLDLEEPVDLV